MKVVDGVRIYGHGMFGERAEDIKYCREEVTDTSNSRWTTFHQCHNKRGFGEDGAYCKRHAVNYPAEGECNDITMYYLKTKFGEGIQKVSVASFTDKTVQLVTNYPATSWAKATRNTRRENRVNDYGRYFETREEAIAFQRTRQESIILRAEHEITDARKILEELKES